MKNNYKSLHAAVIICATLTTDTQTFRQILTGYTIRSCSWAKKCHLRWCFRKAVPSVDSLAWAASSKQRFQWRSSLSKLELWWYYEHAVKSHNGN